MKNLNELYGLRINLENPLEAELIIEDYKPSIDELVDSMNQYAQQALQKAPGITYDVRIESFHKSKNLIGRNQELASNPIGIYFLGGPTKDGVSFKFRGDNTTLKYLMGFYFNQDRKEKD